MERYNKILQSDNFENKKQIFNDLKKQIAENINIGNVKDNIVLENILKVFTNCFCNNNEIQGIIYSNELDKINNYSGKFIDCFNEQSEQGFSYELFCHYKNIDFDHSNEILTEITYLKNLLKIYDKKFKDEIILIVKLIIELKTFFPIFIQFSTDEIFNQDRITEQLNNI